MKKIALIITHNPNMKLIELLKELKYNDFENIVVNANSSSSVNNILYKAQLFSEVINCNTTLKGIALKKGLKYISSKYSDYIVVTLEDNGTYGVHDAIRLCNIAKENPKDLVLGKRNDALNVPLKDKIEDTINKTIFKYYTHLDIKDVNTEFRAFTNCLSNYFISIPGNNYDYELNVILGCAKNKIAIQEIDTDAVNEDYTNHNESLKNLIKLCKDAKNNNLFYIRDIN